MRECSGGAWAAGKEGGSRQAGRHAKQGRWCLTPWCSGAAGVSPGPRATTRIPPPVQMSACNVCLSFFLSFSFAFYGGKKEEDKMLG